ncbi:MarR family winged helix-turn-helix transcriptional regulator [Saccharopolyspora phatthalungensis]|uniref:DNA-binding MarR family transcriptional regulator n=1 Tax=Saccharopolyspora phatthalungensis TaxID=664693 RepID=A0A840Q9W6_9PSEU|nr:MarR family transcriptional regulator [Saccharopolyspora phatthalungensis]MBB5155235.1 DNA-binding MarR family transcriptional regulator [Saccharopolyspora phatthalungensis]
MADSQLTLDRQVCFALYSASRAFTGLYRPLLAELGLTYPQYLVMLVLWERGLVTVKELGAALRLDSGTLSPLLKRLEARGLITRQRSATDERSVAVALTTDGSELRERAQRIPDRMVSGTGLEVDELAQLRSTLERLTVALDAAQREAEGKQEVGR